MKVRPFQRRGEKCARKILARDFDCVLCAGRVCADMVTRELMEVFKRYCYFISTIPFPSLEVHAM